MQRLNLFTYFFPKDRFILERMPRISTVFQWVCVVIVLSIGSIGPGFAKAEPEKVKLDTVVKDFTLKDGEGTDFTHYK
ncbi:hypothetical protein F4X90_09605, partial [Candidatus Poribacteria bacterium]|nr:hypothetical protein [Candidatus Poribacteria bacterium]